MLQGRDHFVQVAFHYAIKVIKGQANAVISDPVLRKIVGSDLFLAPSGTDLTLASSGIFRFLLPLPVFEQAGPEDYAVSAAGGGSCFPFMGRGGFFISLPSRFLNGTMHLSVP